MVGMMYLIVASCEGCLPARPAGAPRSAIRVSATRAPTGAVELQDVTIGEEGNIESRDLGNAMYAVVRRAVAQGGNYVFVDELSTRFEEDHSPRHGKEMIVESPVTHLHARVFRVAGAMP
jgi:hypothetical protein